MIKKLHDSVVIVVPRYEVISVQKALFRTHKALRESAEGAGHLDRAQILLDAEYVWDLLAATGYTEI